MTGLFEEWFKKVPHFFKLLVYLKIDRPFRSLFDVEIEFFGNVVLGDLDRI